MWGSTALGARGTAWSRSGTRVPQGGRACHGTGDELEAAVKRVAAKSGTPDRTARLPCPSAAATVTSGMPAPDARRFGWMVPEGAPPGECPET